jgi:hypothetical protein
MADLVNLKTKNPDLVLVFLPSPGRATPRQASPCLAKLRRASSLRQRFELVLAVLSAPASPCLAKLHRASSLRPSPKIRARARSSLGPTAIQSHDVVRRNRIGRLDRPRQPPRRVQIWGSTERERELRMRAEKEQRMRE